MYSVSSVVWFYDQQPERPYTWTWRSWWRRPTGRWGRWWGRGRGGGGGGRTSFWKVSRPPEEVLPKKIPGEKSSKTVFFHCRTLGKRVSAVLIIVKTSKGQCNKKQLLLNSDCQWSSNLSTPIPHWKKCASNLKSKKNWTERALGWLEKKNGGWKNCVIVSLNTINYELICSVLC